MQPIINLTKDGFLEIEHPALGPQQTRLSADVAASATSSTVENIAGFASGDYTLFGAYGAELTELVLLTSVTASTTLGHTTGPVFAHGARTPIGEVRYNQAEIYTSTAEAGTYALLATIDLTVDQEKTTYDAMAQVSTTWFKVRYKDVGDTEYSDYSDTVVYTGYNFQSLHDMTDEVIEDFEGDSTVKRSLVRSKLRAGVRNLTLELIKTFPDYNRTSTTQDLTSGTAEYDLPTRFLAFDQIWVNFSSTTKTSASRVQEFERELSGEPDATYYTSDPRVYFKDAQFGLKPTPTSSSGRAWVSYWYYPTIMTEEADVHGLPYGGREALVLFALWRLWRTKDSGRADGYREDYFIARGEYIEFIAQAKQTIMKPWVRSSFGNDLYSEG